MKSMFDVAINKGKNIWRKHGQLICSVGAGLGVLASSYFSIEDTQKAVKILDDHRDKELTKVEKVKIIAPCYARSIISILVTEAFIFGGYTTAKKTQASAIVAYSTLMNQYNNYRQEVKEVVGDEKEKEIFKNTIELDKPEKPENGKKLYFDEFSKRWFESTVEDVYESILMINRELITNGYVSINTFYSVLDIKPIPDGDYLGWSVEWFCDNWEGYPMLNIYLINVPAESNEPSYTRVCYEFEPTVEMLHYDEMCYYEEHLKHFWSDPALINKLFSIAHKNGEISSEELDKVKVNIKKAEEELAAKISYEENVGSSQKTQLL